MTKEIRLPLKAWEVRGILDGRKTMLRREVKSPIPIAAISSVRAWCEEQADHFPRRPSREEIDAKVASLAGKLHPFLDEHGRMFSVRCPYGAPGDRLWCQETWARDDEDGALFFRADDNEETRNWERERIVSGLARYRWRPSIHMPRWASRILLEVTAVRVERLQDISEKDAEAEGVKNSLHLTGGRFARENFAHLWWTLHGDDAWEENPWVWCVAFERGEVPT